MSAMPGVRHQLVRLGHAIIRSMPVRRDDVNATPMRSSRPLPYSRLLSSAEVEGLLEGFKPLSMDDKWFFFAEERILHVHRSWTGEEIYSFRISRLDGGTGEVADVQVNNAYPDDEHARKTLDLLFEKILPQFYGD
jgi:hypothetical protein